MIVTFINGPYDGYQTRTDGPLQHVAQLPVCSTVLWALANEFPDDLFVVSRMAIYVKVAKDKYTFKHERRMALCEKPEAARWCGAVIDACAAMKQ